MAAPQHPSITLPLDNEKIATLLEEIADGLEAGEANPFRVRAYRTAAATVREQLQPVQEILRKEGAEGLRRWPGIGQRLARVVEQLTQTGSLPLLDELRQRRPEDLLTTVTGVGPELAHRLVERLGVRTLVELEQAAHDGRLAAVPGVGPKRLRGIRDALAGRLGHTRSTQSLYALPSVADLLEVDRHYRMRAEEGTLRQIAPRRFNPKGEAWLPVLQVRRRGWHFRALFSNTAEAPRLDKTHDWVVIYFQDRQGSGQCTVITAGSGPLRGQRVVRGREDECLAWYRHLTATANQNQSVEKPTPQSTLFDALPPVNQ